MTRKKFKLTGFARFFIFLIFFTPIAFIGASYYNGEDGIENIKNLLGISEATPETKPTSAPANNEVSEEFINGKVERLQADNKRIEQKNNDLHLQIESLQKELEQARLETENLKGQLKAIKDAVGG